MAGALADPADRAVLRVPRPTTRPSAEAFAAADPYVKAGLVTRWEVRAWTVVIGA